MEIKFFKKTIEIFYSTAFVFFVLIQVFLINIAYAETVEIKKCGFSSNGECVVTTAEYQEGDKKITQVMEIPMVEGEDGRVTESYTDNEGKKFYRRGTVNTNEQITYMGQWQTEEEAEVCNTNSNSDETLNSCYEDPNKYKDKNKNGSDNFTYTLLEPLPLAGGELSENVTLEQYLGWAYRFVLSIAAFLAVLQITIGGVMFMASGANETTRSAAKDRIWSAIYGLILALAAYLVLYTINPQLVSFESNSFFNTKKTNSGNNSGTVNNTANTDNNDSNSKTGNKDDRWSEDGGSNIGDFNDTITDTGDIPI